MKKYVLSLICAMSLLNASGLKYQEIDGFSNPESIFVDKDYIYVSNIGKKPEPLEKDGDGFISKLDKNGAILELKFITHLNAPKGMMSLANVLYIVDIDSLYGFDLNSKEELFALPIKDAIFLNDIVKFDDNTLLLSDTATGLIYKFDIKTKQYEEFLKLDTKLFGGVNGLYLKNHKLFMAGYNVDGISGGVVMSYDLRSKKLEILKKEKQAYDGIFGFKDSLLVSSWGENLNGIIYRLEKTKSSELDLPFMKGPADIFVDKDDLWIPKMLEGKILRVKLQI